MTYRATISTLRHVLLALFILAAAGAAIAQEAEEGFKELFNGRDLTGWKGDEKVWSVRDGLLVGETKKAGDIDRNTFLVWTGGEVGDFDLRVEFRLEGDNNSGVQYRSQRIPDTEHGIKGYQADLHPAANFIGMLYDEGGRGLVSERGQKVVLKAGGEKEVEVFARDFEAPDVSEWNVLEIIARGNHVIHKLNGEVTVDITDNDPENADAKGLLALQVHAGAPMKVEFKSVRLKQLDNEPDAAQQGARKERFRYDAAATPVERINVLDGFEVELLYSVPKEAEGSWVNMCVDSKGRLIVSDQNGSLYRISVPPKGDPGAPVIERMAIELGHAQGLLWAHDSLYVVVNGRSGPFGSGLYRARDTDDDDRLDTVELLRKFEGEGEHGPHAVILDTDGQSLLVVCGNMTQLTEVAQSRVPRVWDEDQLLPRIYGVGFMKGTPPPGGCIYRTGPDGKDWELITSGFRNPYDIALNADGELFTYDADMEWDIATPWYRPTRVCHAVSGVDWGWRNGSAKWPVYYADTLPPVADIGLGSPTGITFGYGAKFPAKYQNALYLCDWTYGKLFAVHIEPHGSTYRGTFEEFVTASPLPFTDAVVNPADGAMYFLIGGRNVQSGLYRITYTGDESTAPAPSVQGENDARLARKELEKLHQPGDGTAIDAAWPYLAHEDRFVRAAARTVLEHQPTERWGERAIKETNPQAAITALLALVRTVPRSYKPTGPELDTPPPSFPATDSERHPLQGAVLGALERIEWAPLSAPQRLELLRAYGLALYRLGPPDEALRAKLIARLDGLYPAESREANVLLTELLSYLEAPSAAIEGVRLLRNARTQEEQIDFARSLRQLDRGWTPETRREFFEWIQQARGYKGGNNFATFMEEIRNDAIARIPEEERAALADLIDAPAPNQATPISAEPRPFVREWTMEEVIPLVEEKLTGRDFDHGREMFAAANCFGCHRFANEGGAVGPDLTGLAGRFSPRDILESVLEPNKVISDQYSSVTVLTSDGRVVTGRITNLFNDELHINTNMLDPNALEVVKRTEIEELNPSSVSMMPAGLLNTLTEEELLDLMAFLLSRGDPTSEMFKK